MNQVTCGALAVPALWVKVVDNPTYSCPLLRFFLSSMLLSFRPFSIILSHDPEN